MLFICEVVVWVLFTYCNLKFSVSSSVIVTHSVLVYLLVF